MFSVEAFFSNHIHHSLSRPPFGLLPSILPRRASNVHLAFCFCLTTVNLHLFFPRPLKNCPICHSFWPSDSFHPLHSHISNASSLSCHYSGMPMFPHHTMPNFTPEILQFPEPSLVNNSFWPECNGYLSLCCGNLLL